jgi:peptidoglycan-associated lipoprotein
MRFRILSLIAAAALLAACETAPDEQAAQTGGGDTQPAVAAQPQAAPAQRVGPASGSREDFVVNVGDRIFFDYDKYNVAGDSANTLKKQAAWLKAFGSVSITIEGHCDERGTREYNLALGERRANAVKDYLVALGIGPNRIKVLSYGKERPVALGSNEAAWAQNRRGVTTVTGGTPSS